MKQIIEFQNNDKYLKLKGKTNTRANCRYEVPETYTKYGDRLLKCELPKIFHELLLNIINFKEKSKNKKGDPGVLVKQLLGFLDLM